MQQATENMVMEGTVKNPETLISVLETYSGNIS